MRIATVQPSNKKNPPADEVTEATEMTTTIQSGVGGVAGDASGSVVLEVDLAALKSAWDVAQSRIRDAIADQQAVEASIAAHLLTLRKGQKRGAAPPSVVLGGNRYRAQKPREEGAKPTLVQVPEYSDAG